MENEKQQNQDICDVCSCKSNNLVDYFVLLCPKCKEGHTDINLLRKNKYLEIKQKNEVVVKK